MANSINIKISWLDVIKQSAAMLCNLFLGELSMHYIKKEKEKLIYIYQKSLIKKCYNECDKSKKYLKMCYNECDSFYFFTKKTTIKNKVYRLFFFFFFGVPEKKKKRTTSPCFSPIFFSLIKNCT